MLPTASILHNYRATWILAALNVAIFVLLSIDIDVDALSLSADIRTAITHPWTLFTYMFTQANASHLIANITILTLAGIQYERTTSSLILIITYILGGFAGGIAFDLLYIMADTTQASLSGSSAAVMAVCAATITNARGHLPNIRYRINVIWILGIYAVFCFISCLMGNNPGGNIAHLAGIALGFVIGQIWSGHRKHKTEIKKDPLVTKVEQSGYTSLTDAERQQLFDLSNRTK